MLFRMKQNAMGLASICVLSTIVIVTLSTTISLFVGIDDERRVRYPKDVDIRVVADEKVKDENSNGKLSGSKIYVLVKQ